MRQHKKNKVTRELNFFGKNARLHHIGIAVTSIKDIMPAIKIIRDPIQGVRVAFIVLNDTRLELIEPYGRSSPVSKSLKKGIKLLHLCYTVSDIEKQIKECRKYGFHSITQPVLAAAFNKKVAWIYSKEYGLFELLQD